jgi:hypothetical protein
MVDTPTKTTGEAVACGDRHAGVRFEADPDQLVKARYLVRPQTPIPSQMHGPAQERGDLANPDVLDVMVAPDEASVWDARPVPRET